MNFRKRARKLALSFSRARLMGVDLLVPDLNGDLRPIGVASEFVR